MRFQRLLMEAGGATVTVDLHPRLTVVAGVGPLERESLVTELLASLATSRKGTHLEVVDDTGRRLGVMHPTLGSDRVVEMTTGEDVTGDFLDAEGRIDLLAPLGLDLPTVRRQCRMTSSDVAAVAKVDGAIAALAARDQDRLWSVATRVQETAAAVKSAIVDMGVDPEDAPLVEEIERRHQASEAATARLEYIRHHGIFVGSAAVVGAMAATGLQHWAVFPLLAVAIVTTVVSIAFRRRLDLARRDELAALEQAGADSYLAFRLQQTQKAIGGGDRVRLTRATTEHQLALEAWQAIAGDVSVDWAFELRERIQAAAIRIRESRRSGSPSGSGAVDIESGAASAEPAELAQALIERMTALRHAGTQGGSMPLLLDEPLRGVNPSTKTWMLELIARSAGSPQVVYLTEDPDIAHWARVESISGDLSILEPAPEATPEVALDMTRPTPAARTERPQQSSPPSASVTAGGDGSDIVIDLG